MAPIPFLSAVFPPEPVFTDVNLPSLEGKVYIVTGAASGVGLELAKFLFLAGGTVYVACRSTKRCEEAIEAITSQTNGLKAKGKQPARAGQLKNFVVDLSDLKTIKPAVEAFQKNAERLDVLFNNAAVMAPPPNSKDSQGRDLEVGTNCLGPYLLTLLLEPILIHTATLPNTPSMSVRTVWVVALLQRAQPQEIKFDAAGVPIQLEGMENYFQSKVGSTWLATKFADRLGSYGIMSTSLHPGLMATPLQRHLGGVMNFVWGVMMRKGPTYGAFSELFAGFSNIPHSHNGGHLMAWGRIADTPEVTLKGLKSEKEGGTGRAQIFFDYCDREIGPFL